MHLRKFRLAFMNGTCSNFVACDGHIVVLCQMHDNNVGHNLDKTLERRDA